MDALLDASSPSLPSLLLSNMFLRPKLLSLEILPMNISVAPAEWCCLRVCTTSTWGRFGEARSRCSPQPLVFVASARALCSLKRRPALDLCRTHSRAPHETPVYEETSCAGSADVFLHFPWLNVCVVNVFRDGVGGAVGPSQDEIAFDSAFSKLRMTGTGAQDPVPEVPR